MKASDIVAAAFTASAVQASVARREGSTIRQLLEDISQAMINADDHVLGFQQDPAALHQAGFALLDTLECSAKVANAMPPLTAQDVVNIAGISAQVSHIGSKFLADIEAAAPQFAACGLCDYAHSFSVKFADVSNDFFEASKAKFPYESQAMACEEIASKNAEFARAQAALGPGACVNQVEPPQIPGSPPSLPDTEPTATTTVFYHTGSGLPIKPTPPAGPPGGGHHNGTHSGQPPKPIIGSASAVGSSGVYLLLSGLVAFFL